MKRISTKDKLLKYLFHTIIILAVFVTILPILNVVALSLSSSEATMMGKVLIFPVGFNLEAYKAVFQNGSMIYSLGFTIVLTVVYTVLALFFTLCTAYPLTKERLAGRKFFTTLIIVTMYFSGGVIPEYLLFKELHISNTMWVLVLPGLISAYNMIILKSFIANIPDSIEEAALIDGASDFTILFKIVLPLSKAVMATLSLFYAVSRWNTFQDALYFIQDSKLFPLQYKLQMMLNAVQTSEMTQFEGANTNKLTPENLKSASIVFASVPIILVYPWLQKYFVKGVTLGAVKG